MCRSRNAILRNALGLVLMIATSMSFNSTARADELEPGVLALYSMADKENPAHIFVFEAVDGPLLDRIDEFYRLKYRDSRYLEPMIGTQARAATMEIRPPAGPSRR